MNDWAAGDIKGRKVSDDAPFYPGRRPIYVTLADWFRAARFLSFSLPAMCIDQSLAAIYMPWRCQIVVLRRRALFIMMMCRQRRPPARKKEAHHALLLCRQLFMSFISLCTCCFWWCCYWPRSMRQQNKLRAAFVFAVFSVETPRFAVCTLFYHAILEEKLKINCVSFNL
jgi:hypothetical protein